MKTYRSLVEMYVCLYCVFDVNNIQVPVEFVRFEFADRNVFDFGRGLPQTSIPV
jgi:hypothetical protein